MLNTRTGPPRKAGIQTLALPMSCLMLHMLSAKLQRKNGGVLRKFFFELAAHNLDGFMISSRGTRDASPADSGPIKDVGNLLQKVTHGVSFK